MAESVGIRALQQNASSVVARAANGETIEVTDRGRPVACLIPLPEGRLAALVRAGLARPARRRVADLPDPIVVTDGPGVGEILAAARADER
jgi:prevent-host-death family protein